MPFRDPVPLLDASAQYSNTAIETQMENKGTLIIRISSSSRRRTTLLLYKEISQETCPQTPVWGWLTWKLCARSIYLTNTEVQPDLTGSEYLVSCTYL